MPDEPTTPGNDTPADPRVSHPSRDRLRDHLDDRLPAGEAAEVAAHLERCADCVAALDELGEGSVLERVDPGPLPPWDERRMRRSVRRTLLRTAINAALLIVLGAVLLQLIGGLAFQPLVVDRGDRVSRSVAASIDLPVMTIPGAEVEQFISNPGALRRTTEVRVERAVGGRMEPLGSYETRLGPIGMSTASGTHLLPWGEPRFAGGPVDHSPVDFEPERLGDATAATVQLTWGDPIPTEDADALADPARDVALLWVGFGIGDGGFDPAWVLGYGACSRVPDIVEEARGHSGFGSSGTRVLPNEGGAEHALTELRRAVSNLAETGWLDDLGVGALDDPAGTARWLTANEPDVTSVVLTGPTSSLAATVEAAEPDLAHLLEVDFDRGAPEPCG